MDHRVAYSLALTSEIYHEPAKRKDLIRKFSYRLGKTGAYGLWFCRGTHSRRHTYFNLHRECFIHKRGSLIQNLHGTRILTDRVLSGLPGSSGSEHDLDFTTYRLPTPSQIELSRAGFKRIQHKQPAYILYETRAQNHHLIARYSLAGDSLQLGWWDADYHQLDGLDQILTSYLIGNLVAFALRLTGKVVLHGNAALVGKKAVAWIGDKGAGKSTLSSSFVDAGFGLITDDQLVLHPGPTGWRPGYGVPRIRLWPESLEPVSSQTALSYRQPFGSCIKGWLEVDALESSSELTAPPLEAIYVLEPRSQHLLRAQIKPLSPALGFHTLLKHRLASKSLPLDPTQLASEFVQIARLAKEVPVYSLQLPDQRDALPEMVNILASIHAESAPEMA